MKQSNKRIVHGVFYVVFSCSTPPLHAWHLLTEWPLLAYKLEKESEKEKDKVGVDLKHCIYANATWSHNQELPGKGWLIMRGIKS